MRHDKVKAPQTSGCILSTPNSTTPLGKKVLPSPHDSEFRSASIIIQRDMV